MMHECIAITCTMLEHIEVRKDILSSGLYDYMFTVEEVNRRTLQGTPFRDAYKQVGIAVNEGRFKYAGTDAASLKVADLGHTHIGSIGNLCNKEIAAKMEKAADWDLV